MDVYESYPLTTVCLSNGLGLFGNLFGAAIIYAAVGTAFAVAYLVACLITITLSARLRCCYCYYFGKRCYSGLGRLAGLLFQQREASGFAESNHVVPVAAFSFATLLAPLGAGVVFLFVDYSHLLLAALVTYTVVAVAPGFFLQKHLYCAHCKQAELGCPAYQGMTGTRST